MYCKKCGKQIPEDSMFCSYCGTDNSQEATLSSPAERIEIPLADQIEINENKREAKKTPWFRLALFGIVLVAIIAYFASYFSAKSAAINGNYKQAEKNLIAPGITAIHDRYIKQYIQAGKEANSKNYLAAYAAFEELASEDYADSKQKLDTLKETIYQEAVSLYRKGDTSIVGYPYYKTGYESFAHKEINYVYYHYFELCAGYKNADKYLLLAKATSGNITDREYNSLVSSLDFEDTKEVLMSNSNTAKMFLLGSWKTENGKWEFQMKEDSSNCNLPRPNIQGDRYYKIKNGLYYIYSKETENPTEEQIKEGSCYKIKIIDYQTISVFCYEDGSTYTMHRQ